MWLEETWPIEANRDLISLEESWVMRILAAMGTRVSGAISSELL